MTHRDYQGDLTDRAELAGHLAQQGLGHDAANQKAELFGAAATALRRPRGGERRAGLRAFYVPGRIEVLGKHTDYAGGRSMVAAAERGFCLVFRPRLDTHVTVIDAGRGESVDFQLDPQLVPRGGHWANYPMTVARRIARNFPRARCGAEIAFASDLPPAAGMSSSSALIVATFFALSEANQLQAQPEYPPLIAPLSRLAGYLAAIENGQGYGPLEGDRGVGTFGGSEDHTAILCGRPGRVVQYAYCPVRFERAVPMPAEYTFAIGMSGVVAEKTGTAREKYNRASRLASALAELWRRATGREDQHLAAALASSPDAINRLKQTLETTGHREFPATALRDRLEHFAAENEQIVPAAGTALAGRDLDAFGRLVDRSQQLAEQLLGNQVPQTAFLAATAREHGAAAASAFGGGFGGSVWAMLPARAAPAFLADWAEAYRRRYPEDARAAVWFSSRAGPAAMRVC